MQMKIEKIIILISAIFFSLNGKSFCAQTSQQILSASLPQVLSIEKVIIEQIEYNRDEPFNNMNIKSSTPVNPNSIYLELSPVKVQIHTNIDTPITVYAKFKELKHTGNQYNFSESSLIISPSSYTINNPYDHIISGVFTPYVNVIPNAAQGEYRGSIVFTLGAI